MSLPNAIDISRLLRAPLDLARLTSEGYQLSATSVAGNNSAGALAVGASIGAYSAPPGQCAYIESISLASALDVILQVQIFNAALIANGATPQIIPVGVGPNYGSPVVPINAILREGESVAFILRTAVASGAGTDTLQLRCGLSGYRITNDLQFDAPKVHLAIGDSITNTTGLTYGSEYYHALLGRRLRKDRNPYRRILKGDGGWKSSHAQIAMKRGIFNVPQADLITIMLGTNETLLTDYQAAVPDILSWAQDTFPDALKCLIGPPPRQDSLEVSVMQPIRAYAQTLVAGLGDSNFRYTSFGTAFDPTGDTYYFTADGTTSGNRIHPNALGHAAMNTALLNDWTSSGFYGRL